MKRFLSLLLCLMLLCPAATAMELSEENLDYWSYMLYWMVDNTDKRWVGSEDEAKTYEWLVESFEELGYSYEDETLLDLECYDFEEVQPSLLAVLPAQNEDAKIVTVCAHYDSHSPGARDNASGVAATLMLAKAFAEHGPFEDTELRFIAFTAEETGHQGSLEYCNSMSVEDWERSLATFNIDVITLDIFEENRAFSLDTLGMRTEGVEYVNGSAAEPAYNRAALAMLKAMEELGTYPEEEHEVTWCRPRHLGDSDHESFHLVGIDAVNVCFRGTTASGGKWPEVMHTRQDIANELDYDRTSNALAAIYTAVYRLAENHSYGD